MKQRPPIRPNVPLFVPLFLLRAVHKAQLLTYLKLSGLHLGLILNFNVPVMRDGIVRIVNKLKEKPSASSASLR
jgi:PD-(D/E)XK nuclease superfamily